MAKKHLPYEMSNTLNLPSLLHSVIFINHFFLVGVLILSQWERLNIFFLYCSFGVALP